MPLLDAFKSEQQPLEFVLPRKGPLDTRSQSVDGGVEEPLAPALGALTIARILRDVGDQARIENALAIGDGVKATIEVEVGASQRLSGNKAFITEHVRSYAGQG